MTFSDSPNGGIAGHLAERLDVVRKQQSTGPRTGRRQSGFRTGMAATDYNHFVGIGILHG
jgi:hypothetical protein